MSLPTQEERRDFDLTDTEKGVLSTFTSNCGPCGYPCQELCKVLRKHHGIKRPIKVIREFLVNQGFAKAKRKKRLGVVLIPLDPAYEAQGIPLKM